MHARFALALVIRPFRSNEKPGTCIRVAPLNPILGRLLSEGRIGRGNTKRSLTQGDIRLASMNLQQRKP